MDVDLAGPLPPKLSVPLHLGRGIIVGDNQSAGSRAASSDALKRRLSPILLFLMSDWS